MRWIRADEVRTDDHGWALNLAIFRIVFLTAAALPTALGALGWALRVLPGLPREVWAPISFYRYLPFELLASPSVAVPLAALGVGLIGLGILGVRTRLTLGLAALVSLYVLGLPQNQGKVDHIHHVVWFIALLALGPSGRRLSVDALVSRLRLRHRTEPAAPAFRVSPALFTLRATWILFGLIYLMPGLAKLQQELTVGWTGDNLRGIFWHEWFHRRMYDPTFRMPPRVDLLGSPGFELLGLGVIVFEIAFVGLVLLRPVRPLLAVAGLAFHASSGLLLHIWFRPLVPAYVCLIDWAALGRAATGWMRRETAAGDAPARQRGTAPLPASLRLGAALLIGGQVAIGGLMLALDVAARTWPSGHPVRRGLATVTSVRPVWPFDTYPTFTGRVVPALDSWEARTVLTTGAEVRISPRAYRRALGSTARAWTVSRAIRDERDPERHRARSLDLARLLWSHEPDAVREATVAIRIYRVRYSTDPSEPDPRDLRLLHTFPVESLRKPGA